MTIHPQPVNVSYLSLVFEAVSYVSSCGLHSQLDNSFNYVYDSSVCVIFWPVYCLFYLALAEAGCYMATHVKQSR